MDLNSETRTDKFPLGITQERFWSVPLMRARFNLTVALSVAGEFPAAVLEGAVNRLIARHMILRTAIREEKDRRPVQVVFPDLPYRPASCDLSATDRQEDEIARRVREIHVRGFHVDEAPLFNFTRLRLAAHRHVLVFSIHHVLVDGQSILLIVRELLAACSTLPVQGAALPPPDYQYADYAVAERAAGNLARLEALVPYWRDRLEKAEELFALNVPCRRGYEEKQEYFHIGPDLASQLHGLGRSLGVSLFIILLGVLKAALYIHTGKRGVLVAAPRLNRGPRERDMLGPLASSMLLYTVIAEESTLTELIGAAAATVRAARENFLPIAYIVGRVFPDLYLERTEIAQVQLNMIPNFEKFVFPGLVVKSHSLLSDIFIYELRFNVIQKEKGLDVVAAYNALNFDPPAIKRIVDLFVQLLARIVADPHQRIAALKKELTNRR